MPKRPPDEFAGNCTQCGAALRAGAQFCTACGSPAPAVLSVPVRPASHPARRSRSQRKGFWLLLGAGLLIVATVVVFALLDSAQQPTASTSVAIPTVAVAPDVPYPNVARVSVADAHVAAMSGNALIVDTRSREFYDAGHARGALALPLNELPARLSELPKEKAVLLYCT